MEERFCPNCGSTNVEPDSRHTNQLGEAIFNQNKWLCKDCDYAGIMPVGDPEKEFDEDAEEIEFNPEDQEKVDKDAGRAYAKYFFYIVLPLTVFYIVYTLVSN